MPALDVQNPKELVFMWNLPFAAERRFSDSYPFIDSTRKASVEGRHALLRLQDRDWATTTKYRFVSRILDPVASENILSDFAAKQGIDLEKLLNGAAQHFQPAGISRRTGTLSEKELEILIEDDQRAFDR